MAPLDILGNYGSVWGNLTSLLIGIAFGAVLEMSGFGDSRRLAAQFYFKEMRVLKVMFTAIIVAMTLIFFSSSIEILDFSRIYVNKTYLMPGIIGGIIMGFGFIIGGFCPGTSLVSMSTGKIDGMFFVGGVGFGVFIFGESVSMFQNFFNSSYMGRFLIPELFNIGTGITVVLAILMALAMFYGGEISEKIFGENMKLKDIDPVPKNRAKLAGSAVLLTFALATVLMGQPTLEDRWEWIKTGETKKLNNREIFIHPMELYEVMNDALLYSTILDVRNETDYNLFHIENAKRLTPNDIRNTERIKLMLNAPANTIVVLMSNNEKDAVEAYKGLRAQGILNLYILSGGINNWLDTFKVDRGIAVPDKTISDKQGEKLSYVFSRSVGSKVYPANPRKGKKLPKFEFTRKVKVQKKKVISGSCG